jgi:hypothetical protein
MSKQRQEQRGEPGPGDHPGGADRKPSAAETDGPGSDTERFRALVDVAQNEAVTGESGVPLRQRDHEQRCQEELLDEFS